MGIPTPDKINPAIAGQKYSPENNPNEGGKIKFPAPKKKPNNNKPVNKPFFILHSPFSLIYTKEHVVKQRTLPTITAFPINYETNEPFGIS